MPDSYAQKVRAIMGQSAPPSLHGGQKLLLRCDRCGHAWLMDGSKHRPRLEQEELTALLAELSADLATLPYATCDVCAATHGGSVEIDEYMQGWGYGVSWEGTDPTGAHLLCNVVSMQQARYWRGPMRAGIVTRFDRCRAFLAWLAVLKEPRTYNAISADQSRAMAAMNAPGHNAPGTAGWHWRGGDWRADCPALGGAVLVNLSQAMPPGEPFSMAVLVGTWRALAERLQRGKISGETADL